MKLADSRRRGCMHRSQGCVGAMYIEALLTRECQPCSTREIRLKEPQRAHRNLTYARKTNYCGVLRSGPRSKETSFEMLFVERSPISRDVISSSSKQSTFNFAHCFGE